MRFNEIPKEEMPRERLELYGASSLSNEELLMIILKTGTKEINVKELANNILVDIGGICNLKNYTFNKLLEIKGVGRVKALELLAIIEFSKRINMIVTEKEMIDCTSPINIINYFNYLFRDKKQEEFYVIYLDNKKRYIDKRNLYVGGINMSIVHPREIFKYAYLNSASFMICIHNHPSGDSSPSGEDVNITNKLYELGQLHGISLIDHLIIGRDEYFSFYENNCLGSIKK